MMTIAIRPLVFITSFAVASLAFGSASVERTPDPERNVARYTTEYRIRVQLDPPMTLERIKNDSTFQVVSQDSGKSIEITVATFAGTEQNDKSPYTYKQALLYGDFHAASPYILVVHHAADPEERITVTPADPPADDSGALTFQRATQFVDFEVTPSFVEESGELAFEFDTEVRLPWFNKIEARRRFSSKLAADGNISTDVDNPKVQSSINTSLDLDYRHHLTLGIPLPGRGTRDQVYPVGFTIKPAEFESNQEFTIVNYTAKAQLVFAVPFITDYPTLLWHSLFDVQRSFFPMTVRTGYTLQDKVEDGDDRETDLGAHRWDTEVAYNLPLANRLDATASWTGYYGIDDDEFRDFWRVGGRFYLDEDRTTGLEVSYQTGELQPELTETDSVRVGLSVDFF